MISFSRNAPLAAFGLGCTLVLGAAAPAALADPIAALLAATATPAASAATPAAATVSDPVRDRRIALALKLIDIDGTKTASAKMTTQLTPLITMAIQNEPAFASLPAADRAKITEFMSDEFQTDFLPELLTRVAAYYADNFTESDLQGLIDNFQTPAMQKYTSVRLGSADAMQDAGRELGMEMGQKAIQRYIVWKKAQPAT